MEELSAGGVAIGLDEVGRGPVAGPLTVAAVALPPTPQIIGLDDSKKITEKRRPELAEQVREVALACAIAHVLPEDIDACGMAACLRTAFSSALEQAFEQLAAKNIAPAAVLIDGNPLHIHPLEKNIIKGDAKVACISAASIVAKTTRDALMVRYEEKYPGYGLASNKGYGSAAHMAAVKQLGPTPIHRRSFLKNVLPN